MRRALIEGLEMLRLTTTAAVILAGMTATLSGPLPDQALRNVKSGDQVPDFSVTDLEGKVIRRATHQSNVLLLLFVKPQQEDSLNALKVAKRLLQANAGTKLAVLAVSSKPGAVEYFKGLAKEHGFTFPIALDPQREMYGDFGLLVSPTTLLIDESGVLRYGLAHMPPNYADRVRIHIDHLLGKIDVAAHDAMLERLRAGKPETVDSVKRRLQFAELLVGQGKYAEAVAILTKLKTDKKHAPRATVLLGVAYLGLDKCAKAAGCLDPLADAKPAPPGLKFALARLELRRGNDAKAEKHLLDALGESPRQGEILFELGRLYERQGKLDQAVKCYRQALEQTYGRSR